MRITAKIQGQALAAFADGKKIPKAIARAVAKAGATALRDMRSEAVKRVRRMKRLKVKAVREALILRKSRASENIGRMQFGIDVEGKPVPLSAYPHRQTNKGVSVAVNVGRRSLVVSGFVARMRSGHEGIFKRRSKARLPIDEKLGSRPVDALLHRGEADGVLARGQKSFEATFDRLLPIELDKVK